MDRPNILLIMTDEQCGHAMSCAGNPHVKTPAMDSVARRGVRFTKAYVTQPLCIPFRTAMQMGRYPHETGVMVNNQRTMQGRRGRMFPMIGKVLREAGYDCAYFGKWHISIDSPRKSWHISVDDEDKPIHGYDPVDGCFDREIPERLTAFLDAERDGPFFLTASFMNPHDCIELADGRPLPQGEVRPLPPPEQCPPLPDNFAIPADEPSVIREVQKRHAKSYPTADWDEGKWRQYLWGYYRLIEMADRQIGQVLATLTASGVAENTLVIFTADHGDGAASHHWTQKQTLYDESVRVPFIAVGAGVPAGGAVDGEHLICPGIDLFPTFLEVAGLPVPPELPGRSLRPLLAGREAPDWRTDVVGETLFGTGTDITGIAGRMVRTARYKYVLYNRGDHREQLFDMQTDPGEMHNLANAAEVQTVLADHRDRLARWCRRTRDPFDPAVFGG